MKTYRIVLFAMIILFLFLVAPYFKTNISYLLNPSSIDILASGQWVVVLIWIVVFSAFTLFLLYPRKRGAWKKYSVIYIAYIVALFTEMFGFPLSLYFLSTFLPGTPLPEEPVSTVINFSFFGQDYSLLMTSLIAGFVTVIGGALVVIGWKQIYDADELVTKGIYGYSRHPQYVGMGAIIIAWLFAWPTIPTAIMAVILLVVYFRLAKTEEKELEKEFGKKYLDYKKKTPFLF